MKLRGSQTHGREPHTLAGAYAMDAISAPDRARFERHLAGCEECAQEIAGLREATARLATATAVPPPAGLKERVMAAAALTRQQPPPVDRGRRRSAEPRMRAIVSWFRALALPRRLAVAAAALAAVAVLGGRGGVRRRQQQHAGPAEPGPGQQPADRRGADRAGRHHDDRGGHGRRHGHHRDVPLHARAGVHRRGPARAARLPRLRALADRPGRGPAGDHARAGPARHDRPVIASGLRAGDHLALTAEPAGGAARPTTPMMLDVLL